MNIKLFGYAPIGRIYDPLLPLSQHIHRAMAGSSKVVWTDANGQVFLTVTAPIDSVAPYAVVGSYGSTTTRSEIEAALRLALRERASSWIVDWNAACQLQVPQMVVRRKQPSRRGRRLRPTNKISAIAKTTSPPIFIDEIPTMA